ncbi:MAG: hypothetical protein RBS73_04635 [Prolixibacteraceae bacterium]|nr:hypothetical protein [Prolixibacteraceae bacterium]
MICYKKKVVAHALSEKNRIIRILEDTNIKLSSVLTNIDRRTLQFCRSEYHKYQYKLHK